MKSFFFFDSMLTPKLITVLYWFTLFVVVFSGIMAMNLGGYQGITTTGVFLRIGSILVGVLVARIWFELMIVLFKINDNLQALRDNKE
ncbi:DUF4282 domain-containing protein [Vibrio parahaemolyticus]